MPKRANKRTANIRRKRRIRLSGRGSRTNNSMISNSSIISVLRFARIVLSSLPIGQSSNLVAALFDFGFNLLVKRFAQVDYQVGAIGMFGITPGSLLLNSPLLAKDEAGYSFPGHPVKMQFVKISVVNTTAAGAKCGRWAAVFIPYRETHDAKHYPNVMMDLTFDQISAMPYSRSGPVTRSLVFNYHMRDKTDYCSRPRELPEEIGLFCVAWDVNNAAQTEKLDSSSFNCEIEISGRCIPHVIFGPQHRVHFTPKQLAICAKTKADAMHIHHPCGKVEFRPLFSSEYEMI